MPFSKTVHATKSEWKRIYQEFFKSTIENSPYNYLCQHSRLESGSFTKEIVQNLKNAHLVLADITDLNANVLWELGVRHSLSKRTIMVARSDMINKIPSDIKNYVVIPYKKNNLQQFKRRLNSELKRINNNPEKSDSPVFDFVKEEDLILSSIQRQNIISKLSALLSELLYDLSLAEEILGTKQIPIPNFRLEAMTHLLTTNYITGEKIFHVRISGTLEILENINKRKDLHFYGGGVNFGIIEYWLNYQMPAFKWLIKKVREYSLLIKRRNLEYSEPPILMINEEHKKLLEEDLQENEEKSKNSK